MPGAVDDAEAITITVKSQPDIGLLSFYPRDQSLQVFRLAGVGMMVGKRAVNFAIHLFHVVPEGAEELRRNHTGHAVAAVNDYLQCRAVRGCRYIAGYPGDVIALDVG